VAKAATTTIPIVFNVGEIGQARPCRQPRRPGGNLTESIFQSRAVAKRWDSCMSWCLEPPACVLVNPAHPAMRRHDERTWKRRRATSGLQIKVLRAASSSEINAAFATLVRSSSTRLICRRRCLFHQRRVQLAVLAARQRGPPDLSTNVTSSGSGGLIATEPASRTRMSARRLMPVASQGRQASGFAGRQASKFELVINANPKALGLDRAADAARPRADE